MIRWTRLRKYWMDCVQPKTCKTSIWLCCLLSRVQYAIRYLGGLSSSSINFSPSWCCSSSNASYSLIDNVSYSTWTISGLNEVSTFLKLILTRNGYKKICHSSFLPYTNSRYPVACYVLQIPRLLLCKRKAFLSEELVVKETTTFYTPAGLRTFTWTRNNGHAPGSISTISLYLGSGTLRDSWYSWCVRVSFSLTCFIWWKKNWSMTKTARVNWLSRLYESNQHRYITQLVTLRYWTQYLTWARTSFIFSWTSKIFLQCTICCSFTCFSWSLKNISSVIINLNEYVWWCR
jgi:hypothetical protein